MKRALLLFPLLILLALLCGCGGQTAESRLLVVIAEAEGYTVENNGQLVAPGENAVFTLHLEGGFSLSKADYSGSYHFKTERRAITLTLENIEYPTVVSLSLSSKYCTVNYDANGGTNIHGPDAVYSKTYDLTNHRRPNTERGIDSFFKEGHVLLSWNTKSDGSGERIGLGSRVTAFGHKTLLYAQWALWSDASDFTYIENTENNSVIITGYTGTDAMLVIPEEIGGKRVSGIAALAFEGCPSESIVLPPSIEFVEEAAFKDCAVKSITLFDNIKSISDASFSGCKELQTLYINAIEAPFGYSYSKESCYADKLDAIILAQGNPKLVIYGGCSTWYNLDGFMAVRAIGSDYALINLGLNGVVDSAVQMQIMGAFLEKGDILLHTPEISSKSQLLINTKLDDKDSRLWSGIENNYDLFSLVDLRASEGVFDSLCHYLSIKDTRVDYMQYYQDDRGQAYLDAVGSVPFYRGQTSDNLLDKVYLDPAYITSEGMSRLGEYYDWYQSIGVRIYVSYACVNIDAVPAAQRSNAELMDTLFREAMQSLDGPTVISKLEDYIYHTEDFYDTNYHLLTEPARKNTQLWLRDLLAQMELDGLWEASDED